MVLLNQNIRQFQRKHLQDTNAGYWRENSNTFDSQINVARFASKVPKNVKSLPSRTGIVQYHE